MIKLNPTNPQPESKTTADANNKKSYIEIFSRIEFDDETRMPVAGSGDIRFSRHNISPRHLVVTLASLIEAVLVDAADGDKEFFQKMLKDVINLLIGCNNSGISEKLTQFLSSFMK